MRLVAEGVWIWIHDAQPFAQSLKSIGATWDKKRDGWKLPRLRCTQSALARIGIELAVPFDDDGASAPLERRGRYADLYPYQREAADFLVSSRLGGGLLALSPGLGKTATSLTAAVMAGAERVLVLCPKVLIPVWEVEARAWAGVEVARTTKAPGAGWSVTNYEQATRNRAAYSVPWDLVICDESVLLKNRDTQRWKAVKGIAKHAERLWLLSGGPTTRFVDDLWAQYHLIFPEAFGSYWRFAGDYCIVGQDPWAGKKVVGNRRDINLVEEFRDLQFTRHQVEVLPDLPEVIYERIPVELGRAQSTRYQKALDDYLLDLEGDEVDIPSRMAQMLRLQQIVSHPRNADPDAPDVSAKADALIELIEAGAVETPLLVWTHWRETATHLTQRLLAAGCSVGTVIGGSGDAEKSITAYKAGHLDVLVLSLGVGKYGLTLTNTKTIVYYDKSWDSDAYFQSQYRVRRLGLMHRPRVITLYAKIGHHDTTDKLIEDNLAGKMPSIAATTNADLTELLRSL